MCAPLPSLLAAPRKLEGYRCDHAIPDLNCPMLCTERLVPRFKGVLASGNIRNAERSRLISDRMERVVIYPDEGLHPPMYIALDDKHSGVLEDSADCHALKR
jgi:hypothetical protein